MNLYLRLTTIPCSFCLFFGTQNQEWHGVRPKPLRCCFTQASCQTCIHSSNFYGMEGYIIWYWYSGTYVAGILTPKALTSFSSWIGGFLILWIHLSLKLFCFPLQKTLLLLCYKKKTKKKHKNNEQKQKKK